MLEHVNEVCCTRTLHINEKWQVQVEDEADKGTRNTPALFSEYCRRERTLGGLVNECGARAIEMKESFVVATLFAGIDRVDPATRDDISTVLAHGLWVPLAWNLGPGQ